MTFVSVYVPDKNFSIRLIALFASVTRGNKNPIAIETEKLITLKVVTMVNNLKAVICSPAAISTTVETKTASGETV